MSWQINATIIVSANVEAPSEEIAWDRFVEASKSLAPVGSHSSVTDLTVEDVIQDEIIDESEDDDEQ